MRFDRLMLTAFILSLGACAKSPPQPPPVSAVYLPVPADDAIEHCQRIDDELAILDEGLGGPVADAGPAQPATIGSRWARYGRNLFVETLMGPLQPLIQTGGALRNTEDKERLAADRTERAGLRRAYLLGLREGAGCPITGEAAAPATVSDGQLEPEGQASSATP